MLNVMFSPKTYWDNRVEGYLFLVSEDFATSSDLKKIEEVYYPRLVATLKRHKFEGKKGQTCMLTATKDNQLTFFIFAGVGNLHGSWDDELENVRRAVGFLVEILKKRNIQSAVLQVPDDASFKVSLKELIKQIALAAYLTDYQFLVFKTKEKEKRFEGTLYVTAKGHVVQEGVLDAACKEATVIAKAINHARHLIDMPPNVATPSFLAQEAQRIAKDYKLTCTVLGRVEAKKLGMGGFCAVDAGSDQDGKFIILEYSKAKDAPTIALVGKGVTFDTGGVSLKPASAMTGMKSDMAGAAAVIGTMQAIAQLKPEVNVVAIIPAVENMPSGKSCRQDDIVTFLNGVTAEIRNTDAEGRLILADGLCYAEKFYKPEIIFDIATLTGACVIALGHFYSGCMTRDDKLYSQLNDIGKHTGDRIWRLPLIDDYKPAVRSKIADLSNIGKREYGAGTVTAGMFLEHFVKKARWVHLDIAGTAFDVPDVSYLGKGGATGAGIRLFVAFIMNYKKA